MSRALVFSSPLLLALRVYIGGILRVSRTRKAEPRMDSEMLFKFLMHGKFPYGKCDQHFTIIEHFRKNTVLAREKQLTPTFVALQAPRWSTRAYK